MAIENLLVGILSKELGEEHLNFVFILAEPVDAERCMVIMFVEPTCGIAGKTQCGRTAHSPMRNEQRTIRLEFGARNL